MMVPNGSTHECTDAVCGAREATRQSLQATQASIKEEEAAAEALLGEAAALKAAARADKEEVERKRDVWMRSLTGA